MKRGWAWISIPDQGTHPRRADSWQPLQMPMLKVSGSVVEPLELLQKARIEPDGAGPSLGRVQDVGVGESARESQALEGVQDDPPASRSDMVTSQTSNPAIWKADAISRSELLPSSRTTATAGLEDSARISGAV